MSTFNHSHSHTQSVRHSTHNKQSGASSSLDTTAAAALKLVSKIENELGLDDTSPPMTKSTIHGITRVSPEALAIAADIVSSDPKRFHDFDSAVIGDAAEYARLLTPVLERVEALVRDLQKSLYQRRQPGAQQTLALYAMLKGVGRLVGNAPLHAQVEKLSAALAPPRKTRKLTPEQKQERKIARNKAKRLTKAKAKVAELQQSEAPPPTPPQPAPTPTAPPTGVTVTVSGNSNAH